LFTWQPDKIQHLLGLLPCPPANLPASSDLVAAVRFPQGNQAQIFPVASSHEWVRASSRCLCPARRGGWCQRRGGSRCGVLGEGIGAASRRGAGAGAVPRLVPARRRSLSSRCAVASSRSSPRWPGVIRDPGLPSAVATTGGGPRGGFRFLRHVALPAPSPDVWGGGHGLLLPRKGGCFSSGTVTLRGVPWGAWRDSWAVPWLRVPSDLQLSHHGLTRPEMVFAPERSSSASLRASDRLGPGWWDPAGLVLRWCLDGAGRAMLATGLFNLFFNGD